MVDFCIKLRCTICTRNATLRISHKRKIFHSLNTVGHQCIAIDAVFIFEYDNELITTNTENICFNKRGGKMS